MKAAILDIEFKGPLLPTVHLQGMDNPPKGRRYPSDCIKQVFQEDHGSTYDTTGVGLNKTNVPYFG